MDIQYRIATIDDKQEIVNLYKSAIEEMNNNCINQWDDIYPSEEDITKDIETQVMYVGMKDEKICLAYSLNKECDAQYANAKWQEGTNFIVVHRLCVNPKFQHQQIAYDTMLHIQDECRKYGIKAIHLDAFTQNPYAIALYEKLGYQKCGEAEWRKGKFNLYEIIL